MNEGGLFGEREGWHLPGFDTSSWAARELSEGLPSGGAGVGFFVTTFDLAFPRNTDVLVSFQFEAENTQPYRALLFVNGWKFGKARFAHLDHVHHHHHHHHHMCGTNSKLMGGFFLTACRERGSADEVPRPAWHSGLQRKEVSTYPALTPL